MQPQPVAPIKKSPKYSTPLESFPSTSSGSGSKGSIQQRQFPIAASQIISSHHPSEFDKEIIESTQAIMFDDFESNIKDNMNSTLINRQHASQKNVVLVSGNVKYISCTKLYFNNQLVLKL